MKNNILFYVCVPVYNVEKYLDICIQSVLGQTYQNFRLVLVDDGSPDRCSEICDQYAVQDNRIYVIHQSNMGLIAARQTAIRFVQQQTQYNQEAEPYIVTLDSDDSLKLNALQVAYDNITENNCDLLIFEYDRVSNGAVLEESADSPFYGTITNKNELYSIVLKKEGYNSLCRKIGKLSLYTEVDYSSFYHIKHSEDLLQSLELFRKCKKVVFIKDSLYNYSINPQSMVHTVSAQNVQNNLRNFFEVRGVVAKFIETEYSDIKKVEEYLHDCHRLILREIRHISALPITYGEKVDCFEMMLNDPFCARLLDGSKPYEVILKFLKFRWHHFVIWGSKIGYSVLFAWKQLRQQFQ